MRKSVRALLVLCGLLIPSVGLVVTVGAVGISPQILNVIYRVRVPRPDGNTDFMDTTLQSERNQFVSNGAIFYLPRDNVAGTALVYREYLVSIPDHMISQFINEGGYTTEAPLGYPYSSSGTVRGLTQIVRAINSATSDNITLRQGDTPPAGWGNVAGLSRWGYKRYSTQSESILSLAAGGVEIQSNAVAGGALWRWNWNGLQFVNDRDYGRQIQSAVFWNDGVGHNPTEAGDKTSDVSGVPRPEDRHGSPLHALLNSGSMQVSRAIPLEFDQNLFGGDDSHPAVYQDMLLGKNITLNWNGLGSVAQYQTELYLPQSVSGAQIEIPTAYLNPQPSATNPNIKLTRFFTYDAQANSGAGGWQEVFPQNHCPQANSGNFDLNNFNFSAGSFKYGGIIVATQDLSAAMGIFGHKPEVGGSVDYFTLLDGSGCAGSDGETGNRYIKYAAVYGATATTIGRTLPAGETFFTAWITTSTFNGVVANMHSVYCAIHGC